eukprot:scaffold39101_cov109-Skeletonema_marinoi.AAC.1
MVSFRKKKSSKAAGKAGADDVATPKGGAPPQADDSRDEQPAIPSRPPTMDDIPDLLATMEKEKGEKAANATKRVYELCDVGHKQNRVPMVCSGKYDVLTPLANCLTQESGDGRHLACLALNNLSIPTENKR